MPWQQDLLDHVRWIELAAQASVKVDAREHPGVDRNGSNARAESSGIALS
jgi:hypothetical protein